MKRVAIIPARAGSKSIINKNFLLFKGKPLFYWSVSVALDANIFDNIYVSTDSDEIIRLCENLPVQTIKRPKNICLDDSRDIEYLRHLVNQIKIKEYTITILRPTSPLRKVSVIKDCNYIFEKNINHYDSLRVVSASKENPYKMWRITDEDFPQLTPLIDLKDINEPFNAPRQILPKTFWQTGYLDIVKPYFIRQGNMLGKKIYPYINNENCLDIDTLEDIK
tara:strand:+ start:2074 stop:2739 length:666 start_codon:yes stop_codon:yes gene_type:complete